MTTPTIELKPSVHPLSDAEREAILANPGFGRHFTDHMVTIKWTEGRGWHDAQLVPYAPALARPGEHDPALRAGDLRGPQGLPPARRRPSPRSARRRTPSASSASARRLGMPELPVETFIEACDALVTQDRTGCRRTAARSPCTCGPS